MTIELPEDQSCLLTSQQVANQLEISVRTLQRLVAKGVLPQPIRYNRKLVRWNKADIDQYIEDFTTWKPKSRI